MKKLMIAALVALLAGTAMAGELQMLGVLSQGQDDFGTGMGAELRYVMPVRGDIFAEGIAGMRSWIADGWEDCWGGRCISLCDEASGGVDAWYLGLGAGVQRSLPWGMTGRGDVNVKYMSPDCDMREDLTISTRRWSHTWSQDYSLDDTWLLGVGFSVTKPINDRVGLVCGVGYDFDLNAQNVECADSGKDVGLDFDASGFNVSLGLALTF